MVKDFTFLEGIKNEIAKRSSVYGCINFTPNPMNVLDLEHPFETKGWRMEMSGRLGECVKDGVKYRLMNCLWMPKNFRDPFNIPLRWHLTLVYQNKGKHKDKWKFYNF